MKRALLKLHNYCYKEDYKGYSLYDSHNGYLDFHKFGPNISFISNQIIKRFPINLRRLLGIKKGYNPKGIGLFLLNYTLQKKYSNFLNHKDLDAILKFFSNWLKKNYSKGYSGNCWGYNYSWPKKDGSLVPQFTPSSVVTGFNIRALFHYFLLSKDADCLTIFKGANSFIRNDLDKTIEGESLCYSYTPLKRDITINANLLAAEVLAYYDFVFNKNENQEILKRILNFTMSRQNEDGSWYYSYDIHSGKPKKQIDFHQGYILESIKRICTFSSLKLSDYNNTITKGLKFYRNNQFSENGVSCWRYPKKWPIDIHNQSQGIITFSLFKKYEHSYYSFARKIADWTISNMQGKEGNFYYQKWPLITNKVSYMRWNQAWMMLALTTLMIMENHDEDSY
ncbi:hypothetical protein Dvar_36950 [Desulfosarcina variabilis str. Montpellier]|uniref:hypothetical protein n=1 Tax=Desulfosarcina variabilis TaxID=2300 RepID=UPI003AFB1FAF